MLPVNESDWKLFRKRLPEWQERCMEQLAESYAALLAGPGKASDKFWELEKRLRKDKKRVGVVADVSRSEMYYNLLYLLDDKTITLEDLAGFSPDLRERLAMIARDHFEGVSFLTRLPHIDPMLEVEAKNCPLNYGGKTA